MVGEKKRRWNRSVNEIVDFIWKQGNDFQQSAMHDFSPLFLKAYLEVFGVVRKLYPCLGCAVSYQWRHCTAAWASEWLSGPAEHSRMGGLQAGPGHHCRASLDQGRTCAGLGVPFGR